MLSIFCRINTLKLLRYVSTRTRRNWFRDAINISCTVQSVCERKMLLRPVSLLSDSIDMRRAGIGKLQHSWSTKYWNYAASSFSLTRFLLRLGTSERVGVKYEFVGSLNGRYTPRWTASPLIIRLVIYSTVVGGKKTQETCRCISTCFLMNMLARISRMFVDVVVVDGN